MIVRAARELLINACKHAAGASIRIRLDTTPTQSPGFTVSVIDDGPGFDLAALRRDACAGYGLRRLAADLADIDAVFRLCSEPGAGLAARITWYATGPTADPMADAAPSHFAY